MSTASPDTCSDVAAVATHRAASSSEPYSEIASRSSSSWYAGERQPLVTVNSTPSSDAAAWLSQRGAGYGLCRTYRNEPWHFELRPDAFDDGCPAQYVDSAHDPRMQK